MLSSFYFNVLTSFHFKIKINFMKANPSMRSRLRENKSQHSRAPNVNYSRLNQTKSFISVLKVYQKKVLINKENFCANTDSWISRWRCSWRAIFCLQFPLIKCQCLCLNLLHHLFAFFQYIRVMAKGAQCGEDGPFFATTPRSVIQNGIAIDSQIMITPDWLLIGLMLACFFILVLIIVLGLVSDYW